MKAIRCELCGSIEIIKEDGLYRCNHCNTKYTVAEAAKLLADVKIDHSEEYSNYMILARRAKQENNVIDAEKYYEMALKIEPNDWEAMFFYTYYSSINTRLSDVENAMQKIVNTTASVLRVVSRTDNGGNTKEIVKDISGSIKALGLFYFSVIKEHYQEYRDLSSSGDEFTDRGISIYGMEVSIGFLVEELINDESINKTIVPDLLEYGISILKDTFITRWEGSVPPRVNELYENQVRATSEKIRKYIPNYSYPKLSRKFQESLPVNSGTKKEGCYIATSIYGDYDHPKVIILRRFRDNTLKCSFIGNILVVIYYRISPTIVKIFGSQSYFAKPIKYLLDKFTDYLDS